MTADKRSPEPDEGDEPRPPVVTVSCPNCGAAVNDAELGERTKCIYCGTELHLPRLDFKPAESEEPAAEQAPEPRPRVPSEPPDSAPAPRKTGGALYPLLATGVAAVIMIVLLAPSAKQDPAVTTTITPGRSPELDGVMANTDCIVKCNDPCVHIKDPEQMLACLNRCEDKCKFVGKGTGPECRARCTSRCETAPDPSSRSACMTGCSSECPP